MTSTQSVPLCTTCGTKMRPAGLCYVCEGCGSTAAMADEQVSGVAAAHEAPRPHECDGQVRRKKIDEFNRRILALQIQTKDISLKTALDMAPRRTHDMVHAIRRFVSPSFNLDEVQRVISFYARGAKTVQDEQLIAKLDAGTEAQKLLVVYAELLGAKITPRHEADNFPTIDWAQVGNHDLVTSS